MTQVPLVWVESLSSIIKVSGNPLLYSPSLSSIFALNHWYFGLNPFILYIYTNRVDIHMYFSEPIKWVNTLHMNNAHLHIFTSSHPYIRTSPKTRTKNDWPKNIVILFSIFINFFDFSLGNWVSRLGHIAWCWKIYSIKETRYLFLHVMLSAWHLFWH